MIIVVRSGVMTVPFGIRRSFGSDIDGAIGGDASEDRRSARFTDRVVEPEIADVGGSVIVDDHVVARGGGDLRQVRVHDNGTIVLTPEHSARIHRHDE